MEATPTKTLAEAYDGMLSRDWPKLLDIVDAGGKRIVTYTNGPYQYSAIFHCVVEDGRKWYWGFNQAKHQFQERGSIIEWLEANGLFFFPTQEDLK